MDKGPWIARNLSSGQWAVWSDDFTHDVALDIHGDFGPDESQQYAEWLAKELNDVARLRSLAARAEDVDAIEALLDASTATNMREEAERLSKWIRGE